MILKTRLAWLPHIWPTIILSLPLVVGQVAMIAIWTADIIMMGWISSSALAAGVLGSRLYQPMYFIAIGLTLAVSPLVAQAVGSRNRRQARRVMRQGLWLAVIYGALTMIPMWYGEALLLALGQEPALAKEASLFLKLLAPGMVPTYIYFVLRHYVSAHKIPLPPVIVAVGGVIINIILNLIISKGYFGLPALGLAGIGLATSLTFTLMAIILGVYINSANPFKSTRPFARLYRFDIKVMRRLLSIGIPIGVTLLAETGMFIVAAFYIGLYGEVAIAASGIANQIAAVVYMIPLAISQTATIRVGQEAGNNQPAAAINAAAAAVIVTLTITIILTIILLVWHETFIALFLNQDDAMFAQVIALAVPMLIIVAFFQITDGLQAVFMAILRAINDTRWPAMISIFSYWGIGIIGGIGLTSHYGWGPIGVWWSIFTGLFAGTVFLFIRCYRTMKKIKKHGKIVLG